MTCVFHAPCPYGCAAGAPVCAEGWSLYNRAREVYRQIEQVCNCTDVAFIDQDTYDQLLDEFYRVGSAYSAHIGSVIGD